MNVRSHNDPHAFTTSDERIAFVRRTATAILAARAASESATPYNAAALIIRAALNDRNEEWCAPEAWRSALRDAKACSRIVEPSEQPFTLCDGDTGTAAQ